MCSYTYISAQFIKPTYGKRKKMKLILFLLFSSSLSTAVKTDNYNNVTNKITTITRIENFFTKPSILREIFATQKAFAPVDSPNPECRKQSRAFLQALEDFELWALKMHDATAKISSGLLNGNINQLGDYEQCLNVQSAETQGKYCLVKGYIEPVTKTESVQNIFDLAYSHRMSHSSPFDNIQFFPTFNEISWGFCVPSACSNEDVEQSLKKIAQKYNSTTESVRLHIKVKEGSCVVKKSEPLRWSVIITGCIISSVCILAIFGTVLESRTEENRNKLSEGLLTRVAMAFSLKRNMRDLLRTDVPDDDISCLHGLRAIFSLIIYILHRQVFGLFVPMTNRTELAEIFEGGWTMIFRAFLNNVDAFVIISGLLTSYYSCKKLQAGRKLNIIQMYLTRYIKFTPMFVIVVLMVRDVDYFIRTPQQLRVGQHFIDGCKNNFIKSLFYLNNVDGIDSMCYPPSHQLVTDMQMYLIAPFLILLLWKRPKIGASFIGIVLMALAYLRYYVVHKWNVTVFIYYGIPLSHMVSGADKMYLNPVHRLTPYVSGILLGYYLRTTGRKSRLTSQQIYIGWTIATIFAILSCGSSSIAYRGYEYDVNQSAMFAVFQPILWSISFCWVIYACYTGYGGVLEKFLTWRGFVVFSKISYAFYMSQILLIFTGISLTRNPQFFRLTSTLDLNELGLLLIVSLALTLLFLLPLTHLVAIATGKGGSKSGPSGEGEDSSSDDENSIEEEKKSN